ncbi:transposon Tf2-6 polyprotein [Trichonephila clavipes]|nr:transposon Tf2-6 polyprotein [Trichonephila clavipes]
MFDYEVKYLKGTNNVEADMLSRHHIAQYIQHSVHLLELNEIKTHQNLDNVYDPKYKKVDDVFSLKKKNLFKIVVPFSLRRQILQNAHEQFGHPVTKFPPAYLLFGTLPYTPPLAQNQVYPPVEEARILAKENTIKYHQKNKIKCDARFIDSPFEPGDLVIYEEFNYPNRRKLSPIFSGPYEIVQKLSDVNYEITKPNALTKKLIEIVQLSKLRTYYPPEELKLSHE